MVLVQDAYNRDGFIAEWFEEPPLTNMSPAWNGVSDRGLCWHDDSYIESGAEIVRDAYSNSHLIIRINPPSDMEIDMLKKNIKIITYIFILIITILII